MHGFWTPWEQVSHVGLLSWFHRESNPRVASAWMDWNRKMWRKCTYQDKAAGRAGTQDRRACGGVCARGAGEGASAQTHPWARRGRGHAAAACSAATSHAPGARVSCADHRARHRRRIGRRGLKYFQFLIRMFFLQDTVCSKRAHQQLLFEYGNLCNGTRSGNA